MQLTGEQFLWLGFGCIVGLVMAWVGLFAALRNHPAVLKQLFSEGLFLRMITVVFIVVAASLLAAADKLSAEISAILAAVAGFVLGGVAQTRRTTTKDDDGA